MTRIIIINIRSDEQYNYKRFPVPSETYSRRYFLIALLFKKPKKGLIFHANRLLADDSHAISNLISPTSRKNIAKVVVYCSCDLRFEGYKRDSLRLSTYFCSTHICLLVVIRISSQFVWLHVLFMIPSYAHINAF